MVLGIDIGATTIKCGLVSAFGEITERKVVDTVAAAKDGKFIESISVIINEYSKKHPTLKGVGIGFPGLVSKDRHSILDMANIPNVKAQNVVEQLKKLSPGTKVKIENDAKCATLGEKIFGPDTTIDNFMFVTLGTGVGSGVFIDNKLFLGAYGNACEIGHMLTHTGITLEDHIGLNQIATYAKENLPKAAFADSVLHGAADLSPKTIYDAAKKGDKLALHIWDMVGSFLGETLVNVMRVLDIQSFILGGGVAGAFEFIVPAAEKTIKQNITSYYTDNLKIMPAALSNEAGILGAASLIYHEFFLAH